MNIEKEYDNYMTKVEKLRSRFVSRIVSLVSKNTVRQAAIQATVIELDVEDKAIEADTIKLKEIMEKASK